MDIFKIQQKIRSEYLDYIESFINIKDKRISEQVTNELEKGTLCPDPLIQFNPSYKVEKSLSEICTDYNLNNKLTNIFKGYTLYTHQVEAIKLGSEGKDFIVTSGTGSGKSLTYIATIFNDILNNPGKKGIKAIIVYPMNALINSQTEEFKKYRDKYEEDAGENSFPISFAQYTGQEKQSVREDIKTNPPDILLTNYMMLELMLTRTGEKELRDSIKKTLKFIVFDELHTYRGRQGSDVSMLIRRLKAFCENEVQSIGTSATMASGEASIGEQKEEVANVGSKIFGSRFLADQIIGETLELTTSPKLPTPALLKQNLSDEIVNSEDSSLFINHPLAIWLENEIGLELKDEILVRRKPTTFQGIVKKLSEYSNADELQCFSRLKELLKWAEYLNIDFNKKGKRKTFFPFRIHQFISQTGSVYVTLEPLTERRIFLKPGHFVRVDDQTNLRIYQTVFSRFSGHEFLCVRKNIDKNTLEPRDFRDSYDQEGDTLSGYLIIPHNDSDEIWSDEMLEFLPDAWTKESKDGLKAIRNYKDRIPKKIYVSSRGSFSHTAGAIEHDIVAWFMPTKLLFDPTAGVFYDPKTNEGSKLMRLGNEGRSTATTITSLATVNALAEENIPKKEQKLLSFTDNRQDASLQAGHFSDFVNIGQIRSAIYHALKNSPNKKLTIDDLPTAVFKALNLSQEVFAKQPSDFVGARKENEEALQYYLTIRLLQDLKRGWRYTMPNLEQCGLLNIEYKYLHDEIKNEKTWTSFPRLLELEEKDRYTLVYNTLDFFRTSYAINHRFLTENTYPIVSKIKEKLKMPWSVDENERIDNSYALRTRSVGKTRVNVHTASIGYSSGYGKYLRNELNLKNKTEFEDFIDPFLDLLNRMGFLERIEIKGFSGIETSAYRINATMIHWSLGDGKEAVVDTVRLRFYKKDFNKVPNQYFQKFYKQDFSSIKPLKGKEHTGQISNDQRIEREEEFRSGELSALFCSPTMELGIDISNLNIVHLRNVPPSPANYAQRSGRAGRSGQGALVIAYCSQYSAHDRHYFDHPVDMVAGTVVPPRIDLKNEELIKTHINAIYLLELGLHELNDSIFNILEISDSTLPLKTDIKEKISSGHHSRSKNVLTQVLSAIGADGRLNITYTKAWIEEVIYQFPQSFDKAFTRWRKLYNDAIALRDIALAVKANPIYSSSSDERKQAEKNERQAQRQIDILRNDRSVNNSFSEFYPFRYLASEGFLPGYNFTKLPIRTVVGGYQGAEFISRPRLIALREFGPRNIIYHNGASYSINRLQITDVESNMKKAKISKVSGYFMTDAEYSRETCPITETSLSGDNGEIITNLLEMSETSAVHRQRISTEEEERMSTGFDIETYFSQPQGTQENEVIFVKNGDQVLLEIFFMPSTKIIQVNHAWRKSEHKGFHIDINTGFWRKQADINDDNRDQIKAVKLYTDYTTDALYIQPMQALGLNQEGVLTIQYALKRALEEVYQVESSEMGVMSIGEKGSPNILAFESAEGSLGILSQLVKNKDEFQKLIQEAYQICHFKDGKDQRDGTDGREPIGPASYEDLLSYYNQRHHESIDRFSIQPALEMLMNCEIEIKPRAFSDYEEQYKVLLQQYDKSSSTEETFLKFLYKNGYRLPDKAQPKLKEEYGLYTMPDFQYDKNVFVFCDGSPHDNPEIEERDKKIRRAMRDKSLRVITYHYKDDLIDVVNENKDIIYKVKQSTPSK